MNANQLINMITRMFVRKAVNYGVKTGVNALNRRESPTRGHPQQGRKPPHLNVKQAQKATRLARKIGRF